MTAFFVICLAIFLLLILLWLLFACLILPIWILIHCATSALSGKAKTLWMLFMLLIWPIGGLVYGFFVSKKRFFRWSAGVSFFLFLMLAVGLVLGMPFIFKEGQKQGASIMSKFDHLNMSDMSQEGQGKLKTALETLQREVSARENWLSKFEKAERVTNLYDLFVIYAEDNQLTNVEYRDWMEKYNTRNLIDQDALKEHVRQLKYKRRKANTSE